MTQGIYSILNATANRQYIGSSKDIEDRYKGHVVMLSRSRHDNRLLQAAWDKYGPEAFELVIVEHVEKEEELFVREQFYIDTIKNLYNMNKRADCPPSWKGKKKSPEHIAKIAASRSANMAAQGGMPQETKDKIGRANSKKHSPERIRSCRIARLGRVQVSIIKLAIALHVSKTNHKIGGIKASITRRKGVGYNWSEDGKRRIGAASSKYWRGRKKTPEHVLAATAGRKRAMDGKPHPLLGRKMDPEVVARSAKNRTGLKRTPEQITNVLQGKAKAKAMRSSQTKETQHLCLGR